MKDQEKNQKDKKENQGGMAMRGVTRPMAEKMIRQHHQKHHTEGKQHNKGQQEHKKEHEGDHKHEGMGKEMRENMLHMHHMQTLWIY